MYLKKKAIFYSDNFLLTKSPGSNNVQSHLKLDLLPATNSFIAKPLGENSLFNQLVSGVGSEEQCQPFSNRRGFLITEGLTKKIISMDTGSQVSVDFYSCTKNCQFPSIQ